LRRCGQIAANGSGWEQGEAEEALKTIVKAMDRTEEYGFQGTAPNELPLPELPTRYDYSQPEHSSGIDESCRIDATTHSVFGASKCAADIMTQEYGRYFGMKTCCLRGGCLTGPNHSGVELHGFLSYLIQCSVVGRVYKVYGYKGKQVRDNRS
jgi:CDP-paratose 2-epimerase